MNGFAQGNIKQELGNSTKEHSSAYPDALSEASPTVEAVYRYPSLPSDVSFQQLVFEG